MWNEKKIFLEPSQKRISPWSTRFWVVMKGEYRTLKWRVFSILEQMGPFRLWNGIEVLTLSAFPVQQAGVAGKWGVIVKSQKHLMAVTPTSAKQTLPCYKEEQTAMWYRVWESFKQPLSLCTPFIHPYSSSHPERGSEGNQGNSLTGRGSFPKRIWSVLGFVVPNETALRIPKGFF